jgi:translocation and assembly module TamA
LRPAPPALILACGLVLAAAARAEVPYEVEVRRTDGVEESFFSDDPLLTTLRGASELVTLADRVPQTLSILESRIESDQERLVRVLRAEGYYDGTVEIAVSGLPSQSAVPGDAAAVAGPAAGNGGEQQAQVTISVTPGPQYTLNTYTIDNANPHGSPFPVPVELADIGVALGDPATGRLIVRAQDRLVEVLKNRGRPFAQVIDRMVTADHATHVVDVTLTVDAGPEATFGGLNIEGLEDVEAELIRDRIAWAPGEPFDQAKVDASRTALAQLEVFTSVSIAPAGDWVRDDGSLPMRILVTERDHRTIGGGVSYATSEGPGAQLYWRHRNLFGQAERLELRLAGSRRLSELAAEYRDNSLFADVRYTFTADAQLAYEQTESFTSRHVQAAVGVAYDLDEQITLSAGLRSKFSIIDEAGDEDIEDEDEGSEDDEERVLLVGLPLAFDYDLRDDRFDPTSGGLTRVTFEPIVTSPSPTQLVLRATLYQTGYWAPFDDDSVVLAGWGQLGSMIGADRESMPADERFYVGGGGSVRGFAYQFAGDLDDEGDPAGGQSMLALGAEARFRFLDDYGAVLFIEGGRAFADAVPSFSDNLFWGAGVGARYYTDFGPIRLDFAIPLNGRSGIDDDFQFYVSFGQAF